MAELNKNNFGYLGSDFQYKLVKAFEEQPEYFGKVVNSVDPNAFTEPDLRKYVGLMKDYYTKHLSTPDYSIMSIEMRAKAYTEADIVKYEALIKKLRTTPMTGVDEVIENGNKFFRQQSVIKTATQILKMATNGDDLDKSVELMENAVSAGRAEDYGRSVFDDMEGALADDYRCPIPTGIEMLDMILEGGLGKAELALIIGATGFGKALWKNEVVCTPNGFVPISQIKVGDKVIGKDGLPITVIGVYPQGIRKLYRVSFTDGSYCTCDMEHLWTVNYNCKTQTMTLGDIVKTGLMKGKRHSFSIPVAPCVNFNEKQHKIKPYLAGFILAKQSISKGSFVVKNDRKTPVFKSLLKCEEPLSITFQKKNNSIKFKYADDYLTLLKEEGFSDMRGVPSNYIYCSQYDRIDILHGIFDAVGKVTPNGMAILTTKNIELALSVKQIAFSLGMLASDNFSKDGNQSKFKITLKCYNVWNNPFTIDEFQSKIKVFSATKIKKIDSVTEFGKDEAICIKVDSPDGLFLTKDCIVTHNTTITTAMANYAATYKCKANYNQGFKVLQVVFEDSIKQIQRKHMARITQIEAKDLSKPEFKPIVIERLNNFKDRQLLTVNLRIKKFLSGEITVDNFKNYVQNLINSGFRPDIILFDYFECLKIEKTFSSDNEWKCEAKVMRKMETIASLFNVAVWVTTQGTKDTADYDTEINMSKSSGGAGKIQIPHIVIGIQKDKGSMERNMATIKIFKNRAGAANGDTIINGVYFNNGTCTITTEGAEQIEDTLKFEEKQNQLRSKNLNQTAIDILNRLKEEKNTNNGK